MILAITETGAINAFTAFISAAALVLVAFIGRWQLTGRQEARKDSKYLHEKQEELAQAVLPSNGHDTLGEAIEGLENHLNRIDARLIEGEGRFARIEGDLAARGPRIDKLEERSSETLNLVAENHSLFKNYIEAWTPLAARAVGEWGADGTKQKRKVRKEDK
jgi:hypothetical protein